MSDKPFYKTEQVIIRICEKLDKHETFGATLLNKILYYIDNVHYVKYGVPITELTYIGQDKGATPEPSIFLKIRDGLIREKKAELLEVEYFGRIQKRLVTKIEPDLECFKAEEIALIDDIIDLLKNMNATEISDLSHLQMSWKVAKDKEELPFYTFLLSEDTITDEDISWAKNTITQRRNVYSNP